LEDLTGGVPRVVAYVEREFRNSPERLNDNLEKLRYSFDEVDALLMRQASTEISNTYDERNPYEQSELLAYLEKILLPISGYPRVRDGKLYDKGFIYSDGSVLRPVHGPARRSLLNFFSRYTSFETIRLDELGAGYKFERQILLSTLNPKSQSIRCQYYRQKKDISLPAPLNLYATDFIPLPKDFYLSPALLQYLSENGGNVVFVPEDSQFKAWDFVHYSSSSSSLNAGTGVKTTITFVSTTISEGRPTDSGLWTVDFRHESTMKQSMNKGDVVDKTLSSLGIRFKDLCYDAEKDIFITEMEKEFKCVEVKFVLMTATHLPSVSSSLIQEGQSKGRPAKRTLQNLLIVHRESMERLGIFFGEENNTPILAKGDLE